MSDLKNVDPNGIINLVTGLIAFLKSRNDFKAIRVVKRSYKQLKREFKKDGLSEAEIEALNLLKQNIVDLLLKLGYKSKNN